MSQTPNNMEYLLAEFCAEDRKQIGIGTEQVVCTVCDHEVTSQNEPPYSSTNPLLLNISNKGGFQCFVRGLSVYVIRSYKVPLGYLEFMEMLDSMESHEKEEQLDLPFL